MSIKVITQLPDPSETAAPSSWAVMEARLATTKVHDLLDEASSRLARLASDVPLTDEVAAAVRETLQLVEAGRETIAGATASATDATRQRSPS